MKTPTLLVRARDGFVVSFPRATIAGPGRTPFRLRGKGAPDEDTPEEGDPPLELPNDRFVRQRIRKGDLVVIPREESVAADAPRVASSSGERTPSPPAATSDRKPEPKRS